MTEAHDQHGTRLSPDNEKAGLELILLRAELSDRQKAAEAEEAIKRLTFLQKIGAGIKNNWGKITAGFLFFLGVSNPLLDYVEKQEGIQRLTISKTLTIIHSLNDPKESVKVLSDAATIDPRISMPVLLHNLEIDSLTPDLTAAFIGYMIDYDAILEKHGYEGAKMAIIRICALRFEEPDIDYIKDEIYKHAEINFVKIGNNMTVGDDVKIDRYINLLCLLKPRFGNYFDPIVNNLKEAAKSDGKITDEALKNLINNYYTGCK